ncbi:MAG: MoaD/ThiS family protein [Pseudomonadota bacterium]
MSEPVRVVYLGKLADIACRDQSRLDVHSGPIGWSDLIHILENQVSQGLGQAVSDNRVKVALNGKILEDRASLEASEGDEVALLPPVSGG